MDKCCVRAWNEREACQVDKVDKVSAVRVNPEGLQREVHKC